MEMTPLTPAEDPRVAAILNSAFQNDPVMNWLCDAPGFLPLILDFMVPAYRAGGFAYMASDRSGAALCLGPGDKPQRSGSWSDLYRFVTMVGVKGLYRLALQEFHVNRAHPSQAHYYLFMIGVASDSGGQGVGSALISHLLDRCDKENMPAYLENSNERNLPFYEKHGFRVLKQVRPASNGPVLWLMWREPKLAASSGSNPG